MSEIYKHLRITELADVGVFANWLHASGSGIDKAVSIALHPKRKGGELSFATRDEVMTVVLGGDFEDALLLPLRSALIDQPAISLMCRDGFQDLIDLTRFFSKKFRLNEERVFESLSPNVTGDLRAAANVIGLQAYDKKTFKSSADDAYEIALYLPQYEHGIAPYYDKIALPFSRLQAESSLFTDRGKADWFVSYPDLWVRVGTHYAADPTLTFALDQGGGVVDVISRTFSLSPVQARALLQWQFCGRDMGVMLARFPREVDELPASMPKWALEMDKHYPSLCASTMQMGQAYRDSRAAHTLYGRMLRPGKSEGEAVAFRIFGTVEDIVAVATVSFWANRLSQEIKISGFSGGPDADAIRISGVGPSAGREMWGAQLKKIAPLNNPMTIPLMPTVVLI